MMEVLKESALQEWFELRAKENDINDYIKNTSEFDSVNLENKSLLPKEELHRMEGLNKARVVYKALYNAHYLSGNKSVAESKDSQMRPDLILLSENANYILVELKVNSAEREAVQELLAYSATLRIQLPFVNEFMFIIVAVNWGTLLSYSVRSMIMDGKYVLPLQVRQVGGERKYELLLKNELFDNFRSMWYDPFEAMIPHTYATTLYPNDKNQPISTRDFSKAKSLTRNYLRNMVSKIYYECQRLKQSGFVFYFLESSSHPSAKIHGVTVVTVNQHWLYNENTFRNLRCDVEHQFEGVFKLKNKIAKKRITHVNVENSLYENDDFIGDIFLEAEAYQERAKLFPQNSISFDLLMKAMSYDEEEKIKNTKAIQSFEFGGMQNLKSLVNEINSGREFSIVHMVFFGEICSFLSRRVAICENHLALLEWINDFREFKISKSSDM